MIYIASDHAGFQLKKHLVTLLTKTLHQTVTDLGPEKFNQDDDYPDFALAVAKKVVENKDDLGILICGSGNGICLAANRFAGVRAILGYSIEAAEMGRKEENANVLCLAGRVLSDEHATAIVKKFLETNFKAEPRFVRRLMKIPESEA